MNWRRKQWLARSLEVARLHGMEVQTATKPGTGTRRNDKCPCGSGKKYKKCCLGKR